MLIGLDFDNTIVSYDDVFWRSAFKYGLLSSQEPRSKSWVKSTLIAAGREPDWTWLQGQVYGPDILSALPTPGLLDCLALLRAEGHHFCIVSHKTQFPIRGDPHNLHDAARAWINAYLQPHGFAFEEGQNLHFELTKEQKLMRIATLKPHVFVDDLEEVLKHPAFPAEVRACWYRPRPANEILQQARSSLTTIGHWDELKASLLPEQC